MKMWLLREAELTRLKTVTATLNSPVLQRGRQFHIINHGSRSIYPFIKMGISTAAK